MIATVILLYFVLMKYYKADKEMLFTLIGVFTIIYTSILITYSLLSGGFDQGLAIILLII
jgi:hypothetical protein